jgi:hypothetical protein
MRRHAYAVIVLGLGLAVLACRGPRPALVFSPHQLPEAQSGQAYQINIEVSGNQTPAGQIYVAEGELPSGLTLSHRRGDDVAVIRGTPQAAGRFSFAIGAWCLGTNVSGQTGQQAYTLSVK